MLWSVKWQSSSGVLLMTMSPQEALNDVNPFYQPWDRQDLAEVWDLIVGDGDGGHRWKTLQWAAIRSAPLSQFILCLCVQGLAYKNCTTWGNTLPRESNTLEKRQRASFYVTVNPKQSWEEKKWRSISSALDNKDSYCSKSLLKPGPNSNVVCVINHSTLL